MFVLALLAPSPVYAATLAVPTQYTTIQAAINAALPGDTIEVAAGSYGQAIDLNGKDLTLVGLGGSGTTRIRPNSGSAVSIRGGSNVTMRGFHIDANGAGQGFHIDGSVVALDDILVDNQQNDGTTRSGNPDGGAAYIVNAAAVIVTNSTFRNNSCDGLGGGFYVRGATVDISSSTFDGNDAANGDGGGLAAEVDGLITLTDTALLNNTAAGDGAAAFVDGAVLLDLAQVRFTSNDAQGSAAVFARNATVTSIGSNFVTNLAATAPSALWLRGTASWTGSSDSFDRHTRSAALVADSARVALTAPTFTSNSSTRGGAIAITSSGAQTITDGVFTSNTATGGTGRGGAVDFSPASATASLAISGSRFATNLTGGASTNMGGAIYVGNGLLALTDDDFTDNRSGVGGALYATGSDGLSLTRVVLCANDALGGQGGGLHVLNAAGTLNLRNVVFADNTATGQGGGLFVNGSASTIAASVVNNTFAGNTGSQGGGAYFSATAFDFRNNVVWRTGAGNGVSANAAATAKAYSLVYGDWFSNATSNLGDALGGVTLNNTNLLVDPMLVAFTSGDQTCAADRLWPQFGAPIVNAGDPAILDRDGTRSDIGAYGGAAASAALFADVDADGSIAMFDCNDANAAIHPGAAEVCNLVDDNCNGVVDEAGSVGEVSVYPDVDADTYGASAAPVLACPGANGFVANNADCNDANAAVNPAAAEVCDGVDNNCDGVVDEATATNAGTWYADADTDGFGNPSTGTKACAQPVGTVANNLDCNDTTALAKPGGVEVCDGLDNDCDGTIDVGVASGVTVYRDADGDSYGSSVASIACSVGAGYSLTATDCDDASAAVNPGATEVCNLFDDDCDGMIDEAGAQGEIALHADADGDTYGASASVLACPGRPGFIADANDCDDTKAAVSPAATEVCDGVDNDCDGLIDEVGATGATMRYADSDADGHGDPATGALACTPSAGSSAVGDDCDDANPAMAPGLAEICDGLDNDCDGQIDVGVATGTSYFVDADQDGYGDGAVSVIACSLQPGYSATAGDCDDARATVNPAALERCNGIDDNCDLAVDEATAVDAATWYSDADADGWGASIPTVTACARPTGYTAQSGDCNDADSLFHPYATEACPSSVDYNCDGSVGTADADADGYTACVDCDDADAAIHPSAIDTCDHLDNDCDGIVDEGGTTRWYADSDGDAYGTASSWTAACFAPVGYVGDGTDCDDTNALYHPGAPEACTDVVDFNCDGAFGTADHDGDGALACNECDDFDPAVNPSAVEVCNGIDDDCDGVVDDDGASGGVTWYVDLDGDGFGDLDGAVVACDAPEGYVDDATDCDDGDYSVHPEATDLPYDGVDAACDGGDDFDVDGDRFPGAADGSGEDCDDADPTAFPGADEIPDDGVDQDCDGSDLVSDAIEPENGGCNCDVSSGGIGGGIQVLFGLLAAVGLRVGRRARG